MPLKKILPGTEKLKLYGGVSTGFWCEEHKTYLRYGRDLLVVQAGEQRELACAHCFKDELNKRNTEALPPTVRPRALLEGGEVCSEQTCVEDATELCGMCGLRKCPEHMLIQSDQHAGYCLKCAERSELGTES